MAIVSLSDSSVEVASAKVMGRRVRAWVVAPALAALALAGGYQALSALETPGYVIRHELVAAGAAVARLPWSTPAAGVQQIVGQQFGHYRATVDAKGFPAYVEVTLHGLGPADCSAAARLARIEGQVVIVAKRPSGGDACGEDGVMTWRIMP
ncbi:MAG TPA: hypothetical protein VLX85_09955 [Stellaceae bacterium]|nr:hypothetical protein [Stellaceae bacterium]